MYANSKLDDIIMKCNGTSIAYNNRQYNNIICNALKCYNIQRMNPSVNPYNILPIDTVKCNSQELTELLDFLYKRDVHSFILTDTSTALMPSLVALLSNNKYSVVIKEGCAWNSQYSQNYGVVVELKRKRVSKPVGLPSEFIK